MPGWRLGLPEPGRRGPHHRSGAVRQHRAGRRDAVPVHAARRPGNRRRPWLDDDRIPQLLDLSTGRVQAVQTDINPQARHGADIMSRISYAIQSEEHAARLTALVRETVGRHVLTLTAQAPGPIDRIRIVGNR
ncbi:MAG: hypothetical protein ACLR8Y_16885 [Alistipes indistinctus]